MPVTTYRDALNQALREEMRRDRRIFLIGEDVAYYQGAFKVSKGFVEEFGPQRVIDRPITEAGFTGLAIQKRETLVCDDTQADSRVDATVCKGLNVRSMAVAPIKVNGIIEGVFAIFFSSPRAVSRMHVAMLRTLADAAAVVLEREPAGETQFLAKNSVAPAPVEPAAPADFPVVPFLVASSATIPSPTSSGASASRSAPS